MRRFSWRLLPVLLLACTAGAQVNAPNQNGPSPPGGAAPEVAPQTPSTPTNPAPGVTVTAPHTQAPPLPKLPPDEFTNCMRQSSTLDTLDRVQAAMCEVQMDAEKRVIIDACMNRDGNTAPARSIQACTEALDNKMLEGRDRLYIYVNRGTAFFVEGDSQHALDDYNQAVKAAPGEPEPYYYRGVFYAAQPDIDASMRDFNMALEIKPKLVPALRQRAKLYQGRDNFDSALADYAEAIRLQPKNAMLWCERGHVYLRKPDYQSALKDEAEAIRLDPKLARAYYLRGAASGDLGDSRSAVKDLTQAVSLDPSLDKYIKTNGKTALVTLPPL
jgi:Tfp pilus assembly protein PilF